MRVSGTVIPGTRLTFTDGSQAIVGPISGVLLSPVVVINCELAFVGGDDNERVWWSCRAVINYSPLSTTVKTLADARHLSLELTVERIGERPAMMPAPN